MAVVRQRYDKIAQAAQGAERCQEISYEDFPTGCEKHQPLAGSALVESAKVLAAAHMDTGQGLGLAK